MFKCSFLLPRPYFCVLSLVLLLSSYSAYVSTFLLLLYMCIVLLYKINIVYSAFVQNQHRGLPLITYALRGGGGGVKTNAYKCVQGGRGGLNMTKNTHFVRRFIENATISETLISRFRT